MKKIILFFCFCIFIFSCKKTAPLPNTTQQSGSSNYISSFRQYSNRLQIVDSLEYDASHRITRILVYDYDTTSGNAELDSTKEVFSFSGNDTVPNSYVIFFPGGDQQEDRLLFYDTLNREITDSATDNSADVISLSYPGNNIDFSFLFYSNEMDTLVLSNGNITSHSEYFSNSLSSTLQSVYSSPLYPNPAYASGVANTIGAGLNIWIHVDNGSYLDFISKNLANSYSGIGNGLPPNNASADFSWVTDSKGRVVKGTLALPGNPTTILYAYY